MNYKIFSGYLSANDRYKLLKKLLLKIGLPFAVLLWLISCNPNKLVNKKVADIVPPIFVEAQDINFSKNQDTLFFKGFRFSGHVFHLYSTLDTAFDISFVDGLQEGITRKWFMNKQIAEDRFYIKGKKEGVHRAWWDDGKPKFIFSVANDAYTGNLKEWYNTGQLAKDFHYVNGQEEGSQQMWWTDGRFRANYVVRHGRKYGSIGVKLCLNPNDSIYKK